MNILDHRQIQNKVTSQVCGSLVQVHLYSTYTQINFQGFQTFLNLLVYSQFLFRAGDGVTQKEKQNGFS